MWRPLSWILELIGGARIYVRPGWRTPPVGDLQAPDALGGDGYVALRSARALYEVWGPPPGSPFEPFHCVTLFAALDRLAASREACPPSAVDVAVYEQHPNLQPSDRPLELLWLVQGAMVVVDLEGPSSVALAARLVGLGCQPVCTFDNWPHPSAALNPERVLAFLLRHGPVVARARPSILPSAPPVWICDRDRLTGGRPSPGRFDNRYFLDDTVLPGSAVLRAAGVGRIVVIAPTRAAPLTKDVAAWLADRGKDGFEVLRADVDDDALDIRPIQPVREHFPAVGSRSDAGGFGTLVPEPSSSSS
jgi:hypothetical protein